MDVFRGQVDPDHQIHDLNLDIEPFPSGVFWTDRFAPSNFSHDTDSGRARYRASGVHLPDYHDIVNALSDGPSKPATLSFNVLWHGGGPRMRQRNAEQGFEGVFRSGTASMEWSASVGHVRLRSDPMSTSHSEFAEVGAERNGRYFH